MRYQNVGLLVVGATGTVTTVAALADLDVVVHVGVGALLVEYVVGVALLLHAQLRIDRARRAELARRRAAMLERHRAQRAEIETLRARVFGDDANVSPLERLPNEV